MKKAYVKPQMESEAFVPDEYVAVCLTLWCTLPGWNPDTQDGEYPYYKEPGTGLEHGYCANGSYYNPNRQYEMDQPSAYVNNVVVNGIRIDSPDANYDALQDGLTYHNATWQSHLDGNTYSHRGDAVIDKSSNHS